MCGVGVYVCVCPGRWAREICLLVGLRNMFSTVIICITDILFRLKKKNQVFLLIMISLNASDGPPLFFLHFI